MIWKRFFHGWPLRSFLEKVERMYAPQKTHIPSNAGGECRGGSGWILKMLLKDTATLLVRKTRFWCQDGDKGPMGRNMQVGLERLTGLGQ